ALQVIGNGQAPQRIVVDDQHVAARVALARQPVRSARLVPARASLHARPFGAPSRIKVKVAPLPASPCAVMVPPIWVRRRRAIARPRPEPPARVVLKGAKIRSRSL